MTFNLIAYNILVIGVNESIKKLIEHHNGNPNTSAGLDVLPAYRKTQCQVLLKTIQLLNNDGKPIDDASLILNGLVFHIRDDIKLSYKQSTLGYFTSVTGSDFYLSLTTILNVNKTNTPKNDELMNMYAALEKFFRKSTYKLNDKKASDPLSGYLDTQPFQGIDGYDVVDDMISLQEKITGLKAGIMREARATHLSKGKTNISLNSAPHSGTNNLFKPVSTSTTTSNNPVASTAATTTTTTTTTTASTTI